MAINKAAFKMFYKLSTIFQTLTTFEAKTNGKSENEAALGLEAEYTSLFS